MAKFSDFKIGDTVKIFMDGKRVAYAPALVSGELGSLTTKYYPTYPATIVGTSDHYVNGHTTKHIILGWTINPFPTGKFPDAMTTDYNIALGDQNGNYRYKMFVPSEGYCHSNTEHPIKPTKEDEAEEIKARTEYEKVRDAEIQRASKFAETKKLAAEKSKLERIQEETKIKWDDITQPIKTDIKNNPEILASLQAELEKHKKQAEEASIAKLKEKALIEQMEKQLWPVPEKSTTKDYLATLVELAKKLETKPEPAVKRDTVPSTITIYSQTLQDASIGDTIEYRLGDKTVVATLIARNDYSTSYSGDLALVGFTSKDALPNNTNCYTMGDPTSRFRYYTNRIVSITTDKFIASAAERLDTPCRVVKRATTIVKQSITLANAKLGDKIKVQLGGKMVNTVVMGRNPKAVFDQNYVLLGFDSTKNIPQGVAFADILPDHKFKNYEDYVPNKEEFVACKTVSIDTPCEIIESAKQTFNPVNGQPTTKDSNGIGYFAGIDTASTNIDFTTIGTSTNNNEWISTSDDAGNAGNIWTTTMPITISTGSTIPLPTTGSIYVWDGYNFQWDGYTASSGGAGNTSTPPITLKNAKLGDNVVVQYGIHDIEGTIIATYNPTSEFVVVGYKPEQRLSWDGKVIVGNLQNKTAYDNYLPNIDEFDFGTSFPVSTPCRILPPEPIAVVEPEIVAEPKEKSLSPLFMLGVAAFAGLMKAASKPTVRVEPVIEEADEELIEEVEANEAVRSQTG